MTVVALALAWGLACVAVIARLRPVGATRSYELLPSRHVARHGVMSRGRSRDVPVPGRRTLLVAGALMLVAALTFPPAAFVVVLVVAAQPVLRRRRDRRARASAVERDIGDAVTLLGLAVGAGHNLGGAIAAASQRGDGPVFASFRSALGRVERGERLADVLESLPEGLGEPVRPMVAALVSCDRYGAPLGPTLERLASDVRIASRHRAEAAARRLPVRLLFPLVTCILPAFALLTVAPLIAGSFRGLGL